MAFGDTVTITINSVAKVLNRIPTNQDGGENYLLRETTGEFTLNIRHVKDKQLKNGFPQERHFVKFAQTIFATPTVPAITREISATIVNDRTDVNATHLLFDVGFVGFLTSANMGKLLNWEA